MYSRLPNGYIVRSTVYILGGGGALFAATEWFGGSEPFQRNVVLPVVHRVLDGEDAHRAAIRGVAAGVVLPRWGDTRKEYKELECELLGHKLKNPIGLAAGFDKHAEAVEQLATSSGFGVIEIGSVTPRPQAGNERPRLFRLTEDEAVINRMGFNSDGCGSVQTRWNKAVERLKTRQADKGDDKTTPALLGVNLGKNKDTQEAELDYEVGVNYFGYTADYLVVNVSSPNTPGLRAWQSDKKLQTILAKVKHAIELLDVSPKPKLVLKIAPDISEQERKDIAKVIMDKKYAVDALIVSNTTVSRPDTLKTSDKGVVAETGGLSGRPLAPLALDSVASMYKLTNGKVPIIGCGGCASGEDAYRLIRAGASAVQLYTAIVYQGFPVKRELVRCLKQDGYGNVVEAIGADHHHRPKCASCTKQ